MENEDKKNESQDGLDDSDKSGATDTVEVNGKQYTVPQLVENFKKLSSTVGKQGNELGNRRKYMSTVAEKLPELDEILKDHEEDPKEALKKLYGAVEKQGQITATQAERIQNNEKVFSEFFAKNPEAVKLYGEEKIRYLSDTLYKQRLNKADDAIEELGKLFSLPTKETESEDDDTASTVTVSGSNRSAGSSSKTTKSGKEEKFDAQEIFRKNSIYK